MIFSKSFKVIGALFLCFLMSNVAQAAAAHATVNVQMLSTLNVVEQIDRTQMQNEVSEILKREDVKKVLVANGVAPAEVQMRLASMSPTELRDLSTQLKEARAGGDILVAILLIVLIIYLIKRI